MSESNNTQSRDFKVPISVNRVSKNHLSLWSSSSSRAASTDRFTNDPLPRPGSMTSRAATPRYLHKYGLLPSHSRLIITSENESTHGYSLNLKSGDQEETPNALSRLRTHRSLSRREAERQQERYSQEDWRKEKLVQSSSEEKVYKKGKHMLEVQDSQAKWSRGEDADEQKWKLKVERGDKQLQQMGEVKQKEDRKFKEDIRQEDERRENERKRMSEEQERAQREREQQLENEMKRNLEEQERKFEEEGRDLLLELGEIKHLEIAERNRRIAQQKAEEEKLQVVASMRKDEEPKSPTAREWKPTGFQRGKARQTAGTLFNRAVDGQSPLKKASAKVVDDLDIWWNAHPVHLHLLKVSNNYNFECIWTEIYTRH